MLSRVRSTFSVELPLRRLFETPTVAELGEHVEAARRAVSEASDAATPPIRPSSEDQGDQGDHLLSFAQERLWFLDQLEGPSAVYNVPSALRLTGPLLLPALERALREIVRRHETLRTTFATRDGRAVQVIAPEPLLRVPLVELPPSSSCRSGPFDEVRRLATEEAERPFDLERGPLFRVTLLSLGSEDHVLLLGFHHIVCDGWSIGIFTRELSALYRAFATGAPSPLPELPVRYADYARWQRRWLQGEVLEAQLRYWQRRLAGIPPLLPLPTDRPRAPVQCFRGRALPLAIESRLSADLKILSRRASASLFMNLQAAFALLLSRYTGRDDVVMGSPVANRHHREIEPLIGFFVNTLVLRTELSEAATRTFSELLGQVRRNALADYDHQDLPFERLVEALQPERDLSHTPLFQVMFTFQTGLAGRLELPGLTLRPLELGGAASGVLSKFDLTLSMATTEKGLGGVLIYDSDLFDATSIGRTAGHFKTLLANAVGNPEAPVAALALVSEAERHQLRVAWNDSGDSREEPTTVVTRFELQAQRTAEAVALLFEGSGLPGADLPDQRLSYSELNARSDQLADELRAFGVGPEVRVGICLDRSMETVVGILGVLKAGGAYVPIDPNTTAERKAFVVADACPRVLLKSGRRLAGARPRTWGVAPGAARRATSGSPGFQPRVPPSAEPAPQASPGNAAYVIYTSGSTGKPKGVHIEHRQLSSYLRAVAWDAPMSTALVAPITADAGLQVLFSALLSGGSVDVLSDGLVADVEALAERFARSPVDVLKVVPSYLAALLGSDRPANVVPRRLLIIGGEASEWELLGRVRELAPGRCIVNHYGPTEATVGVATWRVPGRERWERHGPVPIGRPLRGSRIHVLDRYGYPVPIGIPGELSIGGTNVARGYLERPGLTAERFVPDVLGARLYRTGDLARCRRDGNVEYLGRIDHQVKVRGFRVELGEIEAVLVRHPHVYAAAVVSKGRLVAHVAGAANPPELRDFLEERLPDYMVPAHFLVSRALPLLPNGKVHRAALPTPEASSLAPETAGAAPHTATEEILAGIWTEVLGLPRLGIHDNFFELGGHSLLATQVVSRIRRSFSVEIPIRRLFEAPTLAELSEQVEIARGQGRTPAPPIRPVSGAGDLPLSFAQERLWFLAQLEGPSATYNVPAAVQLTGSLDFAALERSLREIVRRHEALRTTFPTRDGRAVQVISPEAVTLIRVVDLAAVTPDEARRLATAEARRPFDLARGPLLRVTLLRCAWEEHLLLASFHHIVSDGWSIGVFLRELSVLYRAFQGEQAPPLPDLPVQVADYAHWQRAWLRGEVLESELGYWKRQLAGIPPLLELPTDRPRAPVQSFRGRKEHFELGSRPSAELESLSRRAYASLFMSVQAAFAILLSRYSGQDDVVVGSPVANRHRREIEPLIGFFVNTLVLRTRVSGGETFHELLAQARETALEAYAHQDLPFERLVEALQPERDLSHTPLFQVMVVLQNAPMEPPELPGLVLCPLEVESDVAKFDLTLSVVATQHGLAGVLEYNLDLFDTTTIHRLAAHGQRLFSGLVARPEARVSALPMLSEAEQHQALVAWGAHPEKLRLTPLPITARIEAHARRGPDAVAVVFRAAGQPDQRLSYQELDTRASQLAHQLHSLGVSSSAEVRVGLCVERTLRLVGLLGILKAGGVYVPFDPAYPRGRLAFMLEDSQVRLVLTQERLSSALPEHGARVVCLDADRGTIVGSGGQFCDEAPGGGRAENLAYVIYTSGSTGKPKGVGITHRGLSHLAEALVTSFGVPSRATGGIQGGDRVLQLASLNFDASIAEIFMALGSGATLCLGTEDVLLPGPALRQLLDEMAVTHFVAAPSVAAVLPAEGLQALQVFIVAGEAVSPELVGRWATGRRFFNAYGPTEATVCATMAEWSDPTRKPPIGRPLVHIRTYVLDRFSQPVPAGVPGELHIGGIALARGYLGQPALSALKFAPDPFSGSYPPGGRLYKSGDLTRCLPDGILEFLGRIDGQVKIRGFRIEPGEVEAALARHPDVRETLVLAGEDPAAGGRTPGHKRLVAYVTAHPEQAPSSRELRHFLKDRLPDHMVPASFAVLDEMPLLPNGKVDRTALARRMPRDTGPESAHAPPRTPTEEVLAEIWADVLGRGSPGIHDNFFELGGDSILSIRIVSRATQAGLVLTPKHLFEHQTIAELAAVAGGLTTVPAEQGPVTGDVALTPIQQWFFEQELEEPHHWNQAVLLEVRERLGPEVLELALQSLVSRHDALRLRFTRQPSGWHQSHATPDHRVTLTRLDLSRLSTGAWRETLERGADQVQGSLSLSDGPLLRAALFDVRTKVARSNESCWPFITWWWTPCRGEFCWKTSRPRAGSHSAPAQRPRRSRIGRGACASTSVREP